VWTCGQDRSDQQDRPDVGNHDEGDDPPLAAVLHRAMMRDDWISAQAEREGRSTRRFPIVLRRAIAQTTSLPP
jgi:hypothetical protein